MSQALRMSMCLLVLALSGCRFLSDKNPEEAKAADQTPFTSLTAAGWVNLSQTYYGQGKYLESVAAAQTAAYLKPDMPEAHNNLGAAYAALHLWDLAIQADLEAVRLNPNMALARNNLAWATEQRRLGR
jgi:tetratricopeptide (TPR) repeat protein